MIKPTAIFFCHDVPDSILQVEYYNQDIKALENLGYSVIVCHNVFSLPKKYDLMFIWWWTHALLPIIHARLTGKPALVTGAFNFQFPDKSCGIDYLHRPAWQKAIIYLSVKLASLNLFINIAEYEKCAKHFKIKTSRYYPLSVSDKYSVGSGEKRVAEILNISWSGKVNLVRKGVPEILHALKILKDKGVLIRCRIAGRKGDGENIISSLVMQLGLNDQISLLGSLSTEEKISQMRECEIYVQPSLFEGFGLATAEAMACGSCVIVCDVGAVSEVVGDAGVYVRPGDPTNLADAIEKVYTDKYFRQKR